MSDASTAIVTGCTSGLGGAVSEQLLGRGWSVVGVSRGAHRELHDDASGRLVTVRGSVDQEETATAAFAAARDLGNLRLVVNCAGQGVFGPVGGYSADDIRTVMSGNLHGLILFSEYAVRALGEGGGDIVNVMSTAGKKLRTAESIYCAAKWGAKAYTRTLRDALKSQKLPIRVFEVYPCGMNTPFWSSAVRPVADGSSFPPAEDIARAVLNAVLEKSGAYPQELTFERS